MVEVVDDLIVKGLSPKMLDKHRNFSISNLKKVRSKQQAYNKAKVEMEDAINYSIEEKTDNLDVWDN